MDSQGGVHDTHPFDKGRFMSEETPDISEREIVEETAVEQRTIPYRGDDLAAALGSSGDVYVHLNAMIAALGLNARGQTQRIQRTPSLAKGLRRIVLQTSGGLQRVNCLRVDRIALWLAGVETSRVKEEFRGKIEAYQDELAPIATRIFLRVMGIPVAAPPSIADPRLAALAEQYETVMSVALLIQDHLNALAAMPEQISAMGRQLEQAVHLLEALSQRQDSTDQAVAQLEVKTQGLTPAQQGKVREAVETIARDSAGKPNELTYALVYQALYKRFQVASYKQLPESQYHDVMQYLRNLWRHATADTVPEQGSIFS